MHSLSLGSASDTHTDPSAQPAWRQIVAQAVTDPDELCRLLDLPSDLADRMQAASRDFRLLLPRTMLGRIRRGDPHDPVLRQFLPMVEELSSEEGFSADPLQEASACPIPGVVEKYQGRSLIVLTAGCPVHCRYCFRRHFTPPTLSCLSADAAAEAPLGELVDHLQRDGETREVILSGGEPLLVDDEPLLRLLAQLAERCPEVKRVRIHTRMPIVIPQRVTGALCRLLRSTRLTPLVVLHVNHPAEIDAPVRSAFARLNDAGIPLLSQSVLLRGVNDSVEVLAELLERLVDGRVIPYYLHQLDRVSGAAHFEVPESEGRRLVAELRRRLPGYAVPRYVRDVPGAAHKEVLM